MRGTIYKNQTCRTPPPRAPSHAFLFVPNPLEGGLRALCRLYGFICFPTAVPFSLEELNRNFLAHAVMWVLFLLQGFSHFRHFQGIAMMKALVRAHPP